MFSEAFNKVGEGVEGLGKAMGRGAGEVAEHGADIVGDGLELVGADDAAQSVRSGGDKLAGALGAHVNERQLDETDDPKQLIHGDAAKIHETASHLKDFSKAFDRVADGMRKIGTGDAWGGKAADTFRKKFEMHPKQWMHAADACDDASKALKSYAETVTWAQSKAADAIEKYRKATEASQKAADAYATAVETYSGKVSGYKNVVALGGAPGPKPQKPAEFVDPGTDGREGAQDILKSARSQRNEAAERAHRALTSAQAHAPQKPEFTDLAGAALKDGATAFVVENTHLAGGFVKAGAETLKLARTVNPLDPYNLSHPWQFAANVSKTAMGLASAAVHPIDTAKGMVGAGWGSDPADATGAMILNLIGGKGAGGLGKSAAKAGARDAGKGAARTAAKDGGKRTVLDRLRERWQKSECGDPVDIATGRMILPQSDIALPGSLPLTFTRTFESSYRTGRWFGPTWMSTVDQRLEIDAEGVILIGEEGNFLLYPHPAVGVPTVPAEGEGRPLERTPDGDYVLTDPATGMRWYFTTYTDGLAVLDEITDRHGNHHTFDYTEDGTPTAITHSAGYRLLLTTENDRVTALHLAGGAPDGSDQLLVTYGYDDAGNLTTTTNSSGLPLRFTYDEAGRITSWTDTNNSSYSYTYDDQDRCIWQSGIDGHLRAHFTWGEPDPVTGLRTNLHHNSHDQVTAYQVNDRHQIVAETDPTGATTRTVRDAKHRILSTTDPLGRTTHIAYDDERRPTTVTLPDGSTTTTTYDADGHPLATTGPDGTTWTQTYDTAGNRTSSTDPAGATTTYTHDHRGHISAVTDALGNTTHVYCNEAGLPLMVTDPLGAVTHYRRDTFGRVTSVTDPLGETTHMLWTVEGKLAARIDALGATEQWTYDGEGNRTTHTDAIGQTTSFEYGHFDLLTARIDPDGVRHEFTHDTELRLTQVTNPQGLTWNYSYDGAGHLLEECDFDDRVLTYTHDSAGQLASRTSPLGTTTAYTRDIRGRVTEKITADTLTTYTHSSTGGLIEAANPSATVTYTRDALGRVTSETVNGRTSKFTYDVLGRRTSRTTPRGVKTTYTYNSAGSRTALNTSGHTIAFDRDAAGRETVRRFTDALALIRTWTTTGRLATQSLIAATGGPPGLVNERSEGAPLSPEDEMPYELHHQTYTYRPDGNLSAIDDKLTGRRCFDLDRSGRVTGVHAAGWTESYAYDEAGNQAHATWPGGHASPSARGNRKYSGTRVTRAGAVRYEHDPLGRVTLCQKTRHSRKPDTWHYTWDAEDRLTYVVTPGGVAWRYLYDPFGRRIAKQRLSTDSTSVTEQTDFTWDGSTLTEQSTHTADASQVISLTWDYQGTTPLTQTERKTTREDLSHAPQRVIDERFFAILTDLIGTPAELVSMEGEFAWQALSTLWGTTTWKADAIAYTPLRFPGQYFDPETQLHYNYHRHYDPSTGRYLSPDPLGLAPSPNPSTYVRNPHSLTDPLGLMSCDGVKPVYRGDARSPDEIMKNGGFMPKAPGSDTPLLEYVKNHIDSDYVSTSKSSDIARSMFSKPGGYVYEIHRSGGIDVNEILGKHNPTPYEHEVVFKGGIPAEDITKVWKLDEFWDLDEDCVIFP
ncbi:putative T7SS-secreted protein [Streptomyces sp. NPDC093589]|uniref:putative T7SS-secreted protein n=1 Tax=Streptomyces sp. NPDC093589 TaxID=3366043 RepID=UPI00382956E1